MKMMANRQPCVKPYRRSVRFFDIQHQFPLTGFISPIAVAVVLVMSGMIQMDAHIRTVLSAETCANVTFCRITSRVDTLMARIEKSAACTEICSIQPLKVQAGVAWSIWSRM